MAADPYRKRWMMFVDGENLAIRGRVFADRRDIPMYEGTHYDPDVFLWFPLLQPRQDLLTWAYTGGAPRVPVDLQAQAVRAFYYASLSGDDPRVEAVRERLWDLGFSPQVFKKAKRHAKAKAVDIALTKDMLSNAFLDNYDVAVLVAGDADYVPLVEEVQRLGKVVCVAAFTEEGCGLSHGLRLSADAFCDLGPLFEWAWNQESMRRKQEDAGPG